MEHFKIQNSILQFLQESLLQNMDEDFDKEQRQKLLQRNQDPNDRQQLEANYTSSPSASSFPRSSSKQGNMPVLGINDSMQESDIGTVTDPSNNKKSVLAPDAVIGEESEDSDSHAKGHSAAVSYHKQLLERRKGSHDLSMSRKSMTSNNSYIKTMLQNQQNPQMTSAQHIVMQQRMEMLPKKHRNKMKLLHPLPSTSQEADRQEFLGLPRDQQRGFLDPNASINTDGVSFAQNATQNEVQEVAFLHELTLMQKINILAYNSFEPLIVAGMLANSVLHPSFGAILGIIFSILLTVVLANKKINQLEFKSKTITVNLLLSVLILVAKIIVVPLGLSQHSPKDDKWVLWIESLGFQFDEEGDIHRQKSIQPDLIQIGISFLYLGFLMRLQRARYSKRFKIGRIQTRIVPHMRQRAIHKDIQFTTPKKDDNLRYGFGKAGEHKMSLKLESNYRKVQQKIYENIIYHSYFGQIKEGLKLAIIIFALLDAGYLQSIPQLIVYLIMIGVIYDQMRLKYKYVEHRNDYDSKDIQTFRAVASLLQALLISQMVFTHALNIPVTKEFISFHQGDFRFAHILGLYFDTQNAEYHKINHILTACFVVQLATLYKSSANCFIDQLRQEQNNNFQHVQSFLSQEQDRQFIAGHGLSQKQVNSGPTRRDQHRSRAKTADLKWSSQGNISHVMQATTQVHIIPEQVGGLDKIIGPRLLLWLARALATFVAYLYHDWQSLLVLTWVMHSACSASQKAFGQITKYFYMPLIILLTTCYFAVNVDQLVPIRFFQMESSWRFGLIKFQRPLLEVLLLESFIILQVIWVRISEELLEEDEDLRAQGVRLFSILSSVESKSYQNLLLLAIPFCEKIVLVIILVSGLEKVDIYHIMFLILFVGFLALSAKKETLTRILILFSAFFILGKYFCSMLNPGSFNQEILEVVGLYTEFERRDEQTYFEYPFIVEEWIVLIAGCILFVLQRMIADEIEIEKYIRHASRNLRLRFPRANKVFQHLYNLKRKIILLMVFATFLIVIQVYQRSLINWGFLIITNLLFYVELQSPESLAQKQKYWYLMTFYSSIAILLRIVFLFCQLPYIHQGFWVQQFVKSLPEWVQENQQIIGLQAPNEEELRRTQINDFVPSLIYFIVSTYIRAEVARWDEDDRRFKEEILNGMRQGQRGVDEEIPAPRVLNKLGQESKDEIIQRKIAELSFVKQRRSEIGIQYNRIRFSPLFIAYTSKPLWPLMDLYAQYNNILMYFVVLLLSLHWWLNLVNCIMMLLFIVYIFRVGKKTRALSLEMKHESSSEPAAQSNDTKRKTLYDSIQDVDLMAYQEKFESCLTKLMHQERLRCWRVHYFMITMVLIIIYPSEFISVFRKFAIAKGNVSVQTQLKTVIYYMFLSGVYNQPSQDADSSQAGPGEPDRAVDQGRGTSGYLAILSLCILERVCLSWIENRFGCDQEAYSIIDLFQKKIRDLEKRILKIQSQIKDAPLLVKRAKMRARRAYALKEGEITASQVIARAAHESLAFSTQSEPSLADQRLKSVGLRSPIQSTWQELKAEILQRLLIDPKMNMRRGFKVLLECTITSATIVSALIKMNVQSICYFLLIAIVLKTRHREGRDASIRILMNTIALLLILRLFLVLSNLDEATSPMPFPAEFRSQGDGTDAYLFPWIQHVQLFGEVDQVDFTQWSYFFGLVVVKGKLSSPLVDFSIIVLVCVYYQTCQFWLIESDSDVIISQQTENMMHEFILQRKGIVHKTALVLGKAGMECKTEPQLRSNHSQPGSGDLSSSEAPREQNEEVKLLIKELLSGSLYYGFYKVLQRFVILHYGRFMAGIVLLLAAVSNTLFSLGVLAIISYLVYENRLFLDTQSARKRVNPLLRDYLLPFLLLEIGIHFVFQVPLKIFSKEYRPQTYHLAEILGIHKIWEIASMGNTLTYRTYSSTKVLQLSCKALVYLLVSLQIQIIDSKSFQRIKTLSSLSLKRGQAIIWRFNNEKITMYLQYQTINLRKELMMIKVKEKCDKWRELFEKQAEQQQKRYRVDEGSTLKRTPMQVVEEEDASVDLSFREMARDIHGAQLAHRSTAIRFEDTEEGDTQYFQSVNTDYLQFRRLTTMRQASQRTGKGDQDVEEHKEPVGLEALDDLSIDEYICTPEERRCNLALEQKRGSLSAFVRLYLFLREQCVNPILFINDKERVQRTMEDVKRGETLVRSSIERAILADLEQEKKSGKQSSKNVDQKTTFWRMGFLYLKLAQQIVQSNLDTLSYVFMITATIQTPGFATLVYPFSVFGFGAMEETRPKKHFWQFIILYTQFLLLVEFALSLKFWQEIFMSEYQEIQTFVAKYYIGITLDINQAKGNEVLLFQTTLTFLPKVLILGSAMAFCHTQIMLRLFEKREQDKESMSQAYIRFIKGKFGIQIDEAIEEQQELGSGNIREELSKLVFQYNLKRPVDDTGFTYYKNPPLLSKEEMQERLEEVRPYKSEQDLYDDYVFVDEDLQRKQQINLMLKLIHRKFYLIFVDNAYMQRLFPSLKIQKPGIDYYEFMVSVQVLMCLFILIMYPEMDAEHSSILSQVNRNQFSGHMVVVLAIMIFFMIVERYIYKAKSFRQVDSVKQLKVMQNPEAFSRGKWPSFESGKTTAYKKESAPALPQRQLSFNSVLSKINTNLLDGQTSSDRRRELAPSDSQSRQLNLTVLARSTIKLRTVMKFYFQWLTLLMLHILLFFYLPISGNQKYNQMSYCDPKYYYSQQGYKCNDLNKNKSIALFYVISCVYFFISALQVRHGLPEVMRSYFMMNRFHYINKYIFLGYYNIPFIFELRCCIDWTYTQTSLDVYQWIKLNQIQADLYKSKCNNAAYFLKPVGERLPTWYKYLTGLSMIGVIFVLLLGPMFLFSSFNIFGEINPVSSASITFKLNLQEPNGVTSTYKLFETMTIQKKLDELEAWEYTTMGLGQNFQSRLLDKSQVQYLIMNNSPQEDWRITIHTKKKLIESLERLSNSTAFNSSMRFDAQISYQFTRSSPKTALTPQGSQTVNILQQKKNFDIIDGFMAALKGNCSESEQDTDQYEVVLEDQFTPVIDLGQTNFAETVLQDSWNKTLILKYEPCNNIWFLNQALKKDGGEQAIFSNITSNQTSSDSGLSIFVMSRRTLPSYLTYPLLTFYISIVYVIAKLFRSGMVPITSAIYINDAPDPDDILMLCETIILYRMKERHAEEEELFFLLIDIMRSPQVFKAISGESIRTLEKQEQQEKYKIKQD